MLYQQNSFKDINTGKKVHATIVIYTLKFIYLFEMMVYHSIVVMLTQISIKYIGIFCGSNHYSTRPSLSLYSEEELMHQDSK